MATAEGTQQLARLLEEVFHERERALRRFIEAGDDGIEIVRSIGQGVGVAELAHAATRAWTKRGLCDVGLFTRLIAVAPWRRASILGVARQHGLDLAPLRLAARKRRVRWVLERLSTLGVFVLAVLVLVLAAPEGAPAAALGGAALDEATTVHTRAWSVPWRPAPVETPCPPPPRRTPREPAPERLPADAQGLRQALRDAPGGAERLARCRRRLPDALGAYHYTLRVDGDALRIQPSAMSDDGDGVGGCFLAALRAIAGGRTWRSLARPVTIDVRGLLPAP